MVARLSFAGSMFAGAMFGAALCVASPAFGQSLRLDGTRRASPLVAPAPAPAAGVATPTPSAVPPTVAASAPPLPHVGTKMAWRAGTGAPHLLWTGFRAQKQDSEVLIQTSSAVEIEPGHASGHDVAVFVLKHCRAPRRTDRLPLETRFFDSPVTRVAVRQRGPDLEVTVSLRGAVSTATRKEAGPGGSWFWVLRFPPTEAGSRPTTASAVP